MKISTIAIIAASAIGSAGVAASYAGAPDGAAPHAHHERMHFHKHGAGDPPLARLVQRLELSDTQQQSVQSIIESSDTQRRALREEMHAAFKAALSTMPDDPGYPALIEKRKQLASTAIQQRSDVNVQIYSLLTEEQKAQVPQLIEDMKAHAKERWEHKRGDTQD